MANRAHALPDDAHPRPCCLNSAGAGALRSNTRCTSHIARVALGWFPRARAARCIRGRRLPTWERATVQAGCSASRRREAHVPPRRGRNGAGWVWRPARFATAVTRSSAPRRRFALRHFLGAVSGHIDGAAPHARTGSACAGAGLPRARGAVRARAGGGARVQAAFSASRRCAPHGPRRYRAEMALDGCRATLDSTQRRLDPARRSSDLRCDTSQAPSPMISAGPAHAHARGAHTRVNGAPARAPAAGSARH
jgi:hypothetical protein